jgi:hypothetical protein
MKTGLLIFGILIIAGGIFFMSNLSTVLNYCQSGTGAINESLNFQVNCGTTQTYSYWGYGILILGGILLTLGLITSKKKKNPANNS